MRNAIAKFGVPAALALFTATAHASFQVTMTLSDATTYAENSSSFDATLNGTQIINGNDLIGIYAFNVNQAQSNPKLANPFYSVCLSPAGYLDWGTHTYDVLNFSQANPGLNPSSWANPVGADFAGIKNATYLFTTLSGEIRNGTAGGSGSSADQGAAMALAMYDALYNSTAYGVVGTGNSTTGFYAGGLAGSVLTDYTQDLALLKGIDTSAITGYVLRPNPTFSGAGQDQILINSGLPNGFTPVPEPTTILAGALLILPFGASALKVLRKSRVA